MACIYLVAQGQLWHFNLPQFSSTSKVDAFGAWLNDHGFITTIFDLERFSLIFTVRVPYENVQRSLLLLAHYQDVIDEHKLSNVGFLEVGNM